jgi:hypothetical protein
MEKKKVEAEERERRWRGGKIRRKERKENNMKLIGGNNWKNSR